MEMYNPPHPGRILKEYMGDISVTEMAKHLGVPRSELSQILKGKKGISAEMSLRLSKAFSTHDELWLKLQNKYDLWQARHGKNVTYQQVTPVFNASVYS
ncbi:HigA family addiction module antidote protein [Lonepinella koalarum]|uniref:XRE family plasmid maintenance system antidote protein n=1 Tax=Lonepinella koalarum TaxID=53417 RepID=A0A4V2PUF6_9PAST|nr:HigA family addiction module antitoxin [Lonepinella koalarum]MDH2926602.1 transcriptional regulator [Lonepinella koalarum]TCK69461.1 XRE family plasmid maintenance system antidote protein [Lonepinella koalarum]TFJ89709.1 addiction module antidote protein, HigA family [Lonepinella koalarum]TYG33976.1 HigA family addiction module antidote protein [Lonepinella koalarum]